MIRAAQNIERHSKQHHKSIKTCNWIYSLKWLNNIVAFKTVIDFAPLKMFWLIGIYERLIFMRVIKTWNSIFTIVLELQTNVFFCGSLKCYFYEYLHVIPHYNINCFIFPLHESYMDDNSCLTKNPCVNEIRLFPNSSLTFTH